MKKIFIGIFVIIVSLVVISCMAPVPMTMPPPPQEPKGSGSDDSKFKKMCVGRDCRKMGAIDGGGTTRGHTDDEED